MIETQSHRVALDMLCDMGTIFFSGERLLPKIKLRLFPLLIGPTGVGKSFAVEEAALKLKAHYFKLTRGDWLVMGARGRPTVFQLLDRVVGFDRVLLHLDELDKFSHLSGGPEWSAAIASDVWNILDGKYQYAAYLSETTFPEREKPSEPQLADRVRSALWIVGSGTWQSVFARARTGAKMGFCGSRTAEAVDFESIARSETISPELLHRFGEAVMLEYPSAEETEALLESTGLSLMARTLEVPISAKDIDWTQGGMRVLETLATRLAITRYRQERKVQSKLLKERLRKKWTPMSSG